ncbi:uncharacterized protein LOC132716775 [Ruditapes philippinarum]|uniref:uncharacterized protein LOC132716775 n=1 Tax=Ruditapes philippinarum TaxID=129788 RepID=UPI00295B465B|nr:uncharacterized protein LOC132716775 [Ruditapes philippinarum]
MKYELLLTVLALASTYAFSIHMGNIEEKLRLLNPSLMMMEQLFNLQDENQCLEKMFCLLETEMADVINNPLKHYSRVFTNIHNDIDPIAFKELKALLSKYPHISKMVHSMSLGQVAGESKVCQENYKSCQTDKTQLLQFAALMGDDLVDKYIPGQHDYRKRNGDDVCKGVKIGCSLAGGGCAACALLTEGACAAICVPALGGTCAGIKLGCIFG